MSDNIPQDVPLSSEAAAALQRGLASAKRGEISPLRKKHDISGDRAYKVQERMRLRLWDIYRQAFITYPTYEQLSEQVRTQVLSEADVRRCPQYVRAYLSGMWDTLRETIYQEKTVWVLWVDGKLITSKEVNQLTQTEQSILYHGYVERCKASVKEYHKHGGSCRQPPTREEFDRHISRFLSSDYRSPWQRTIPEKSRHVWKDRQTGLPLYDKPF